MGLSRTLAAQHKQREAASAHTFSAAPAVAGVRGRPLIALDVALALLAPSFWALASVPAGVAALWWGAVAPEERYLREKFGPAYDDYSRRVRRWL